jgi:hypothetical protein
MLVGGGAVANTNKTSTLLVDELAALDPARRRELAAALRSVADTLAEVRDGKKTSMPTLTVGAGRRDGFFLRANVRRFDPSPTTWWWVPNVAVVVHTLRDWDWSATRGVLSRRRHPARGAVRY